MCQDFEPTGGHWKWMGSLQHMALEEKLRAIAQKELVGTGDLNALSAPK